MTEQKDKVQIAAEWVEINERHEGQRVDNFLLTHLKGVPKSLIYRILRSGEVRVNKGRIKPAYRLQLGDVVRVPPLRRPDTPPAPQPSRQVVDLIIRSILYEDNGLLVINKPSGVAVHGGSGLSYGVIEALRIARPDARDLELVHRLDRDTSGCLMIAKKRSVLRALHTLLREDGVDKRYVALLKGRWRGGERRVTAALKKNVLLSGERVVRVGEDGKASETLFRPLRHFASATMVEALPRTGRTHQIRVHAAHLGQPIAADDKYGDDEFNAQMRQRGLRRLFLHAASLRFTLPGADRPLEFRAPLGPDLETVLAALDEETIKES